MNLFIGAFPLLSIVGLLMLAPAPLTAMERRHATVTMAAILLLSTLTSLLMIRMQAGNETLTTSRLAATTLVILGAGFSAAPLLERARSGGLVIAATGCGVLLAPLLLHGALPKLPGLSGVALLYAVLIASTVIGLLGSMQLPVSQVRYTADGAKRVVATHATLGGGGWLLVTTALVGLGWTMLPPDQLFAPFPLLVSAVAAGLLALFSARTEDALLKAGEGIAAGSIIALMGLFTPGEALVAGMVAGASVVYAEAIAFRLRIDDAPHLLGVVLVPAGLGLLAPAAFDTALLAAVFSWLAVSAGIGVLFALVLWPLTKLTLGLSRV